MTRRNPQAGVLVVKRSAATESPCAHRIFLDQTAVADLRPNEMVTIYAQPGEHVLSLRQANDACRGESEVAAISAVGKVSAFDTVLVAGEARIVPVQ